MLQPLTQRIHNLVTPLWCRFICKGNSGKHPLLFRYASISTWKRIHSLHILKKLNPAPSRAKRTKFFDKQYLQHCHRLSYIIWELCTFSKHVTVASLKLPSLQTKQANTTHTQNNHSSAKCVVAWNNFW